MSSSNKCTLGPSNQLSRNISFSQEEALGSIFELNAEKWYLLDHDNEIWLSWPW